MVINQASQLHFILHIFGDVVNPVVCEVVSTSVESTPSRSCRRQHIECSSCMPIQKSNMFDFWIRIERSWFSTSEEVSCHWYRELVEGSVHTRQHVAFYVSACRQCECGQAIKSDLLLVVLKHHYQQCSIYHCLQCCMKCSL